MELSNIGKKILLTLFSISHLNSHRVLSTDIFDCLRDITDNTAPEDSTEGIQEEKGNVK